MVNWELMLSIGDLALFLDTASTLTLSQVSTDLRRAIPASSLRAAQQKAARRCQAIRGAGMYCMRDANRLLISRFEEGRHHESATPTKVQHFITQLQQYSDRHATCFARDELTPQATAEQLAEMTQIVTPIMEHWLRTSQPLRVTSRRQTGNLLDC